jgi:SAM-dependent methyltransferase
MAAGETPIKQAIRWIDDRLRDDPRADRSRVLDEAARRFDLSPLDAEFLLRIWPGVARARERRSDPPRAGAVRRHRGAYVTSASHAAGDDLDQLVAWGRAATPRRVLDLATGGGHTALAFSAFARELTAFDVTEPMLRAARSLLGERGVTHARFVTGDVARLPFIEGAFEVVTCRLAAHHFADLGPAVREIQRVLRPGGTLLVEDILGHDDAELAAFSPRWNAAAMPHTSAPIGLWSGRRCCAGPGSR